MLTGNFLWGAGIEVGVRGLRVVVFMVHRGASPLSPSLPGLEGMDRSIVSDVVDHPGHVLQTLCNFASHAFVLDHIHAYHRPTRLC